MREPVIPAHLHPFVIDLIEDEAGGINILEFQTASRSGFTGHALATGRKLRDMLFQRLEEEIPGIAIIAGEDRRPFERFRDCLMRHQPVHVDDGMRLLQYMQITREMSVEQARLMTGNSMVSIAAQIEKTIATALLGDQIRAISPAQANIALGEPKAMREDILARLGPDVRDDAPTHLMIKPSSLAQGRGVHMIEMDALVSGEAPLNKILASPGNQYFNGISYYDPVAVVQDCVLAKPVQSGPHQYRPVIRVLGLYQKGDTATPGRISLVGEGYYKFPGFPIQFGMSDRVLVSDIHDGPPSRSVEPDLTMRIQTALTQHFAPALDRLTGMSPHQAWCLMQESTSTGDQRAGDFLKKRLQQWFDIDCSQPEGSIPQQPPRALPRPS